MNNLTVKQWAKTCGIPTNQLMTQVKVLIQEMTEIAEGILEKNHQEIMDGVSDVDWMIKMLDALLDDEAKEVVGDVNFQKEFTDLLDLIEKHYPGLLDIYFEDFKQAVLESNFSKFCNTIEEVEQTISKYKEIGVDVSYREVECLYVIYSTEDQDDVNGKHYNKNKILKGINFFEPNIKVEYKNPLYNKKITQEELVDKIVDVKYLRVDDTTTTICAITLDNEVVLEGLSACINPEDFDEDIGKKTAFNNAFDKLWQLEGYHRKSLIFGK